MSNYSPTSEAVFGFPGSWPTARRLADGPTPAALNAQLQAALQAAQLREEALCAENQALVQHQHMLTQEFEHRLVNGLQLIASMLSLQSRTAPPEAAAQLTIAARRVVAFGRVHHRLQLLDHQKNVELKQYLEQLCGDLASLLFTGGSDHVITVEGETAKVPTALAIPLGFIVNELITNSVKYAKGKITVRLGTTPASGHTLSVLDDGPGLPAGFDLAKGRGLGMKVVQSFVQQIGGELQILPGENGQGVCFTVAFARA